MASCKKKMCFMLLVFLSGCTSKQFYVYQPPKTQLDFQRDDQICREVSSYGNSWWMFGPALIIFPIWFFMEMDEISDQKDYQACMVKRGYSCTNGCYSDVEQGPSVFGNTNEDINSVELAKIAYRSGRISKSEYKEITRTLKAEYRMNIKQIENDYLAKNIDSGEYKRLLSEAKMAYKVGKKEPPEEENLVNPVTEMRDSGNANFSDMGSGGTLKEKLEALKKLLDEGYITQSDYDAKKKELLSEYK